MSLTPLAADRPTHRARRLGIDTGYEAVVYLHRDSPIVRSEGFNSQARVEVHAGDRAILATLGVITGPMLALGERLHWPPAPILDKHSVGGIPGNRTSLLVVPIVAAAGLLMPKTSSRAITSPAGTADTIEMLAPVDLDLAAMRRVVEREGGCLVWGGRSRLSPADDVLIRVERPLDLDSSAQLVASVLSKKAAAGASHVLIDVPVGPTAKIRSFADAERLTALLRGVGEAIGLQVRPVLTPGAQPIGRGIGPALEARDALAALQGLPDAPADLRERSLLLAGHLLELAGAVPSGSGQALARTILEDGRAWRKFEAICEAQGGRRTPPVAPFTRPMLAAREGRVTVVDNRRLARVAKLAGAPQDPAAGLEVQARLGDLVARGQPLYTVHAATAGELEYAVGYAESAGDIITLDGDR